MAAKYSIEWRPINGHSGYEVSSNGQVRSWLPLRNRAPLPVSARILKSSLDKNGYARVALQAGGGKKSYLRVCRLVCAAWHGQPKRGMIVRHLDGTKFNDVPNNLCWGTAAENSADMLMHGTRINGASVNTSKLSLKDVEAILSSKENHSALARNYGVTPCAIWHIRAGRTWKHVPRN